MLELGVHYGSCETCFFLYRRTLRVRHLDGSEYESTERRCSVRNQTITYPVDDCGQYVPWERKGK